MVVPSQPSGAIDLSAGLARRSVSADGIDRVSGSRRDRSVGAPVLPAWSARLPTTVDESTFSQPVDFPWSAMIVEKFGKALPATLSESALQVFIAHHVSPRPDRDAHSRDRRRAAAIYSTGYGRESPRQTGNAS